ncbi:MAG: hypothetical protein IJZ68_08485 [Bacteroidaceae bacterium]|nr:hypothetical protein [Bacteroidaceae bacterium]
MTREEVQRASERVDKAKSLIEEIQNLELLVENLDIAVKPPVGLGDPKKPRGISAWFGNKPISEGYEKKQRAAIILFDTHTMPTAGIELPVDEDFLRRLKNYFAERLEKRQQQLADMDLHEG